MSVTDAIGTAGQALSVKRVFGEPYEKDGMTVIPVARFGGGGGLGEGNKEGERGHGGGFGLGARPAGMYVIGGGKVRWQPAVDVNRVIWGGQLLGIVIALVVRAVLRARFDIGRPPGRRRHRARPPLWIRKAIRQRAA